MKMKIKISTRVQILFWAALAAAYIILGVLATILG